MVCCSSVRFGGKLTFRALALCQINTLQPRSNAGNISFSLLPSRNRKGFNIVLVKTFHNTYFVLRTCVYNLRLFEIQYVVI